MLKEELLQQRRRECTERYRRSHRESVRRKARRYYQKSKLKVIEMLGGKCCNCGNEDIRVLQVNHINGGGSEDNKLGNFYRRIVNGTRKTEDLELLCANCNIIYEYKRGKRTLNVEG